MEYHLSIAGERSGPLTQFNIIEGIREGRFKGDELAWRLGLPDWQPLRAIADFDGFWPVSEETRQQAETARQLARAELDRPRPWLRYWARMIDNLWFGVLLIIATSWFPLEPSDLPEVPWQRHIIMEGAGILSLLLYVPLEAWMLSRFGTTPGRSLLCIQVRRLDGGLPQFSQALRRSFQVFVYGLGLGLFLVQFIAMLWSKMTLTHRGVTPWDESNETRVEHGEPEAWRYLVLVGVILGVLVFAGMLLASVGEEMSRLPN